MELRHLRYFKAVAETLNFRRAAEQLHLSQPALSRQIKDLETELGVQLLERDTRGTSLTAAGQVLFEEAQEILERLDLASDLTREAAAGRRGKLTIGAPGSLSTNILSEALSTFRARFPRVAIDLHDVGFRDPLGELRDGSIHLGFSFSWKFKAPRGFESVVVWKSKARVAVGAQHPMATYEKIAMSELSGQEILCMGDPNENGLHQQRTLEIFSARELPPPSTRQVGSLESLVALIAGNYGVSLLFPNLTYAPGRIHLLPMVEEGEDLEIKMTAVWKKNSRTLFARNFVDVLREATKPDDQAPSLSPTVLPFADVDLRQG